ncbi:MaoC family dehydratase [Acinetobacter rathckeae]|uniref:MaoC family dehydratase n=1 Tax=Acinetobacter rathckeae TaxID=2605272 RepID=UPI0018A2865E|nr:MaoC family dehydratase [Acinetobacter rathckeae]MBF7687306.1 MaoC family dehydratase [Acinetobacter rathckeae]MBF7696231.1 MaoC family dehydratase [Acinetobacter rathckeae]
MKVRYFNQMPKACLTYPAILAGALAKNSVHQLSLPKVRYEVAPCLVSAKHLVAYNKVCGFENNGDIPAIYFAMRAQILHMYMMTQEEFPFSVLSLIHEKNQITQYKPLRANLSYKIICYFGELIQAEHGVSIEFVVNIYQDDDVVTQVKSTYLKPQHKNTLHQPQCLDLDSMQTLAQWRVTPQTIRHYAYISGDFNPVHLHGLGAKAFGLEHAIAHGMWTQATMMARLDLPLSYDFTVYFERPLYVRKDVVLLVNNSDQVSLVHAETGEIYVSGQLEIPVK